MRIKEKLLLRFIADAVRTEVDFRLAEQQGTYSTLELHFGEGSEPQTLSIPYQAWRPRESVNLPDHVLRPREPE